VYFADSYNNRIRKVELSTGFITTFAGSGATGHNMGSFSGDGGAAASATLNNPFDVVLDSSGCLYIVDNGNNRIRKVEIFNGLIYTIAGTGASSYSGDGGVATSAALYSPSGIAVVSSGLLYISDNENQRIRKLTIGGTYVPTVAPSTLQPTMVPSNSPSSAVPSMIPSVVPSLVPLVQQPSNMPSTNPSATSTGAPSGTQSQPSHIPSLIPSAIPNPVKSDNPTPQPTIESTISPSESPSTGRPTAIPSSRPSGEPTIMPTSSAPTTFPTSMPTAAPTETNLVAINLLETTLTAAVVRDKTKYYLGFYVIYFFCWYALLYIAGYSRIGKDKVNELYRDACKIGYYKSSTKQAVKKPTTAVSVLREIYDNNERLQELLKLVSKHFAVTNSALTY